MPEFCCPQCGHKANLELSAVLPSESKVSIVVQPLPDQMMSAKAIGGVLENFHKLQAAVARQIGVKCDTLIEHVSMENGAIRFDFRVLNVQPPRKP